MYSRYLVQGGSSRANLERHGERNLQAGREIDGVRANNYGLCLMKIQRLCCLPSHRKQGKGMEMCLTGLWLIGIKPSSIFGINDTSPSQGDSVTNGPSSKVKVKQLQI